jgi:hypothetical protein
MNKNFPRSLHPKRLRTTDAPCSHKGHCGGVVREVIGYLEHLVSLPDSGRDHFVYASVSTILEGCKRYALDKKGKVYKRRAVEGALAFLMRRKLISHRLKIKRRGVLRDGYVVTPHEALFVRTGTLCEYVGRLKPGTVGVWQRDTETRSWYWVKKGLGKR